MELQGSGSGDWQLEHLVPLSASQIDHGHVLCPLHISTLSLGFEGRAPSDTLLSSVLQAFRAVAWCSGWRAANCTRGFGNNARCDEVLLATACEDAETSGRKLGLSTRLIDSMLEAIHCTAWHCANTNFGSRLDAEEDIQTAQKHWAILRRGAELDIDVLVSVQKLIWSACWCTANWRSGSDAARTNMKMEQRHAKALGLPRKSAWAPHMNHRMCNKEMICKQTAVTNFLFSNSLAATAEQGGLKHGKVILQQKLKKCMGKLNRRSSQGNEG